MLNPRAFLEDCIRHGKLKFWRTGLPWAAIDSRIDQDTLEYSGTEKAEKFFENVVGLAWDNLKDSPDVTVQCPAVECKRKLSCPWTTCDESFFLKRPSGELGHGFADKQFQLRCDCCYATIDHGVLRTQRFRNDLQQLLLTDTPMPGTILSFNGKKTYHPFTTGIRIDILCSLGISKLIAETEQCGFASKKHSEDGLALDEKTVLFPNRLILIEDGLSKELLERTDIRKQKTVTVNDIRTVFEKALNKKTPVRASRTGRLIKPEKIAVRRMMSRYWDNSSTFALDLVGAVVRQGSFIEKMHSIDWVHSPAVDPTMTRLIAKYGRYFEILAKFPAHVAVPTLDVDLAWFLHPAHFSP